MYVRYNSPQIVESQPRLKIAAATTHVSAKIGNTETGALRFLKVSSRACRLPRYFGNRVHACWRARLHRSAAMESIVLIK
jgi:hypothetical protein